MAELPDRHAPAFLATKLYVPRLPPGFVPRPRLAGMLETGLSRELTLVCAPAGFGKTSLLADLCRRSPRPVGWLSLDEGDNDPARFWRHVAAALDQVRPGIAERVTPAPGAVEGAAADLINELAAQPGDTVLVLDDYHVIDALPVHASLEFLLGHQPPGLHVVLASRTDPPLPLARWRDRGRLAELRADVLRFTGEEAADLLRGAVGAGLGDDAVAALAARTEGWAAGLQLAALSLLATPDIDSFVATFSGSNRFVLDYLTEEVLGHQSEPVREFLLETSVLERLSGPLCDALTGRADGQAMLESIERANLFLSPLDDVRGWWRYHHLFADLLRARLRQQRPERQRELHRNAAAWHEAHGSVDEAVRHALAAGDATRAAQLLERHFDELQMRSEVATVQRWFAALPADLSGARPRLVLAQAHYALLAGRLDEGERLLEVAERAWPQVAGEPYEPSAGRAASLLVNVPAWIAVEHAFIAYSRGDAERTARFASRALAGAGADEPMLETVARGHLTMARWLRGEVDAAEHELVSQIATLRTLDKRDETAWVCGLLGQVQSARGDLDAAAGTYRQALELAAPAGRVAQPAAAVGHTGLAEVAYQRNDLDAAARHLADGLPLCRRLVYTQSLSRALATLAWVRHARGDEAAARQAADEAAAAAPGPDLVDLFNPVPAQRARLLLALGDVDAAARWTAGRGVGADDEPGYPREPAYLVLARVLLAQGRSGQALRLLGRLHAAATAQHRIGGVIEIQALRALALAAEGRPGDALAALTDALRLAHPRGHLRVFADEGRPMAALLARLGPAARSGRLMRAFGQPDAPARTTDVPGLVAGLSARELEVLRLMAAGRQNKEIADQLYVAVDTVKKHVTHILEKLGASNRTQATARARELGLLP